MNNLAENSIFVTGFICGAFDLLHPGHILAFKLAKNNCDRLVVGLQVDPSVDRKDKNKPVETIFERYLRLKECKYVNEIIPYETEEDLLNILKTIEIDVRFLDEDYENLYKQKITGEDIVPIKFLPRKHSFSSRKLIERLKKGK